MPRYYIKYWDDTYDRWNTSYCSDINDFGYTDINVAHILAQEWGSQSHYFKYYTVVDNRDYQPPPPPKG
jgi:hypothetical protein